MSDTIQIAGENLSVAWVKALAAVMNNPNKPLCVSIFGLDGGIREDTAIRSELNRLLQTHGEISVRETSETIFPYNYWMTKKPPSEELAAWYTERFLPRHKARVKKVRAGTPRETYFERLVAYTGYSEESGQVTLIKINQLERILTVFKHYSAMGKNPSPSKYIATCLNPSVDNGGLSPYVPFPCLQQIGFSFVGGSVIVNGFYTIQYLMKRGYGNYLGLCYLGMFMSKETGLPLSRVNCFVGNPRADGFTRKELVALLGLAS